VRYQESGDNDRAIQKYDQALRLLPNDPLALTDRGNTYREKGDFDRAFLDYESALRSNPNYALAFLNRGALYSAKGDEDHAIGDYDQAIRLAPNQPLYVTNRAIAYGRKGEYGRALQDFDAALRLNPNLVQAFYNRGIIHFYNGRFAEAALDFAKSADLEPRTTYPLVWLYLARTRAGQDTQSLVRAATPRATGWPGAFISLYAATGDQKAMLASMQADIPKFSRGQQCEAYFFVGEYFLMRGRKPDADAMFEHALATGVLNSPYYYGAKIERERLGNQ
jgi:lipoprotein NlpI